jgi:AAA domain, putative AbiEii toxin, Type IV TA system/AAA ATPase domain
MLRELWIENFRALRQFGMTGLGQVNLLVGTNNCGKTSVLEAIDLLSGFGSPTPLRRAQLRRGEFLESAGERYLEVAHLFHGHQVREGALLQITGNTISVPRTLTASFVARRSDPGDLVDEDGPGDDSSSTPSKLAPMWLRLEWDGDAGNAVMSLRMTRAGGVGVASLLSADTAHSRKSSPSEQKLVPSTASFIATDGLSRQDVVSMFEQVVLTPDEDTVLQALRTIEPAIERLASIGTYARWQGRDARGGLAMMVAGQRMPIGSMGDGIWRLLGIALALVSVRGGVLLVDEIDTGLHYSVLIDMWRLVFETARRLDVQVFATTHSRDCYEALAAVTEADRHEISLQRIERGKLEAIAFTEAEIRQAAERGLEVR